MTDMNTGFSAGIDFGEVLGVLSKQIYETPLAFIRENVQNAVDAIRIAAHRLGVPASHESLFVRVQVSGWVIEVADTGIGMSAEELQKYFWTIGASGKRTLEARAAGCVGMFGIGGFANFGVCDELTVISRPQGLEKGRWTQLTRNDIKEAQPGVPEVASRPSNEIVGSGTIVRGRLESEPNVDELRQYLREFVRHASERVFFEDELVSGASTPPLAERADLSAIDTEREEFEHGQIGVQARLYRDQGSMLLASLDELRVGDDEVALSGQVRFEGGAIDVLRRGFKICTTTVGTRIGVSGTVDCDRLAPTAGRDSLNSDSTALLGGIVAALERAAVLTVLDSSDMIAQHTRIFPYVRQAGLIDRLGKVEVALADGGRSLLGEIRRRAEHNVTVHFATGENRSLAEILNARGDVVVQLPGDRHKQRAVRDYLTRFCGAKALEGRVECASIYDDLSRFEKAFLSELEDTILTAYEASGVKIVPGKLTEDIPVFVSEGATGGSFVIYTDVRHPEVSKLETLGITPLFTSMVAHFCRAYLAGSLRSRSPKYFGSGAVNMDWLSKRRSELWVLMTDDIHTMRRGVQKQVVRSSDVQVLSTETQQAEAAVDRSGQRPKLVRIDGNEKFSEQTGYYLRIPSAATDAFGDVIVEADYRGAVWVGNKITFVASDTISSAFHFEVRLDRLIVHRGQSEDLTNSGAEQLDRPIHSLFDGLYFPIPFPLEDFLVPKAEDEIRIEVHSDWVDFDSARSWEPRLAGEGAQAQADSSE